MATPFENYVLVLEETIPEITKVLRLLFYMKYRDYTKRDWKNHHSQGKSFINNLADYFYSECNAREQSLIDTGNIELWPYELIGRGVIILFKLHPDGPDVDAHINDLSVMIKAFRRKTEPSATEEETKQIVRKAEKVAKVIEKWELRGYVRREMKLGRDVTIAIKRLQDEGLIVNETDGLPSTQTVSLALEKLNKALSYANIPNNVLADIYCKITTYLLILNTLEPDNTKTKRDALNCAKRTVELCPKTPKFRHWLGTAYHALGKFDKAKCHLLIAMKTYDNDVPPDVTSLYERNNKQWEDSEMKVKTLLATEIEKGTTKFQEEIGMTCEEFIEKVLSSSATDKNSATAIVAAMYMFGFGVEVDHEKAFKLCFPLRFKRCPPVLYNLGYLYLNGLGVKRNPDLAYICFFSASEKFESLDFYVKCAKAESNFEIGHMCEAGVDVFPDKEKAMRFYERAFSAHHVIAQLKLWWIRKRFEGSLEEENDLDSISPEELKSFKIGVKEDSYRGLKWFRIYKNFCNPVMMVRSQPMIACIKKIVNEL